MQGFVIGALYFGTKDIRLLNPMMKQFWYFIRLCWLCLQKSMVPWKILQEIWKLSGLALFSPAKTWRVYVF